VLHTAIFKLLSQIAGAAAYVLLVRLLSEGDYGYYQLLYSIPVLIGAVFSLGIGNALSRFLPEYFENRWFGLARRFLSWCFLTRLLTSVVVLSLIIFFWDLLAPIIKIENLKEYFYVFAFITVTHFQCGILTLTLSAFLLQQWSSGLAAAFTILKVLGYAVASLSGLSLEIALIVDLVAYIVWYLGLHLAYARYIPNPELSEAKRFSADERRRVIRYAAFYNFNDVGSLALSTRADYLFIAGFLSPLAVGAYAFCTQLDVMLRKFVPTSFFMNVVQPLVFTLDYETQKDRARQYFQFLIKLTYLFQFPVLVFMLSVPTQMINVAFAGKFVEYSPVLVAIFIFSTVASFQVPVGLIAQLGERAAVVMASKVFSLYNIAANVLLIPRYGIMGAVIATGSANILKNVFIWSFVREVASFRGTGRFFLNQAIVWIICWAILATATPHVSPVIAVTLGFLAVGTCGMIGLRLADFSDDDCKLIRKIAGERISSVLLTIGAIR